MARVFVLKVGVLPDRVLVPLLNDRMVAKVPGSSGSCIFTHAHDASKYAPCASGFETCVVFTSVTVSRIGCAMHVRLVHNRAAYNCDCAFTTGVASQPSV